MSKIHMIEVLEAARNCITDEKNWAVHEFRSLNKDGVVSFCARGAILEVIGWDKDDDIYCAELAQAIPLGDLEVIRADVGYEPGEVDYYTDYCNFVACYNNTHTHKDVLAMFDTTIARLKSQRENTLPKKVLEAV